MILVHGGLWRKFYFRPGISSLNMLKGQGHFHFAKDTSIGKSYTQWTFFEGAPRGGSWPQWLACNSMPATLHWGLTNTRSFIGHRLWRKL